MGASTTSANSVEAAVSVFSSVSRGAAASSPCRARLRACDPYACAPCAQIHPETHDFLCKGFVKYGQNVWHPHLKEGDCGARLSLACPACAAALRCDATRRGTRAVAQPRSRTVGVEPNHKTSSKTVC